MPYKNKEQYKTYQRELWKKIKKNPKLLAERNKYRRDKRNSNLLERRKKEREYARYRRGKLREEIFEILGKICCRCGFSDPRALQFDHIKGCGKGKRIREQTANYRLILKSLKKGEKEYQVLCANCNWIKRYENKELPSRK